MKKINVYIALNDGSITGKAIETTPLTPATTIKLSATTQLVYVGNGQIP